MKKRTSLPIAARFKVQYDVERLVKDYHAAVEVSNWINKPKRGKYIGWSAIALVARAGASGLSSVDGHISAEEAHLSEPTAVMEACPYIEEILNSLSATTSRARFMRLAVGGIIGLHRDPSYGWESEMIRLHIPIITNPQVTFILDGVRLDMGEGQLWYLDTTKPHEVRNESDVDRIHLVIDVLNTDETRAALDNLGRVYEQKRSKSASKTARAAFAKVRPPKKGRKKKSKANGVPGEPASVEPLAPTNP